MQHHTCIFILALLSTFLLHNCLGYVNIGSKRVGIQLKNQVVRSNNPYHNGITMMSTAESITLEKSSKPKLVESFGKGLLTDITGKLPYYKSDFIDGLNIKSVASTLFLFFACLAPAVAFGGLLGVATNGNMGTIEALG